jgi:hypothetical protein
MAPQVKIALLLESGLICFTTLLLTQPNFLFRPQSQKGRDFCRTAGLFFLCVTFCWSIVFGCILAVNSLSIRL